MAGMLGALPHQYDIIWPKQLERQILIFKDTTFEIVWIFKEILLKMYVEL